MFLVTPGLTRGPASFHSWRMERERQGGWGLYHGRSLSWHHVVGVTADLASRIHQHRSGEGSDFCARYGLLRLVWAERGDDIAASIDHEKCLKRWRREWKFASIERGNPEWQDMFDLLG